MVYIFRVILVSSASLILSSFMSMLPFSLVLLFPFICPFPSTLYRFCFILCYYCVSSVCLDLRQVVLFPSYYVCEIVFHTIAFFRLPHLPPVFCVVSLSSVSISLLLPPSHLCGLWFVFGHHHFQSAIFTHHPPPPASLQPSSVPRPSSLTSCFPLRSM